MSGAPERTTITRTGDSMAITGDGKWGQNLRDIFPEGDHEYILASKYEALEALAREVVEAEDAYQTGLEQDHYGSELNREHDRTVDALSALRAAVEGETT